MNNSKTPKIVVGVGLVAVYAAALISLALRGEHDSAVAQGPAAAAATQMVAAAAPPPVGIPDAAETLAPATTPAPTAPVVTNAARTEPRAQAAPVASLPTMPATRSDAAESSRSNSGSNAVGELPPATDTVADESVTSADDRSADQDSQSTTEAASSSSDN